MRLPETDRKEEWFCVLADRLQRIDGSFGNPAIKVRLVRHVATFETTLSGGQIWWECSVNNRLVVSVIIVVQHRWDTPRGGIPFPVILSPVVKDLSDTFRVIAIVLEQLRQRDGIGPVLSEVCWQIPAAERTGPQTSQ